MCVVSHPVQSRVITMYCRCVSQYLILKIFFWDLDGVILDSVSVPLVGDLLGHQLFEDEEQQLVVVSAEGQIAGECLSRHKNIR